MESDNRILVGQIMAAHGIKGEVKIKSFTDNPLDVAAYGAVENEDSSKKFILKILSENQRVVVARIKGMTNRNDAEALAKAKTKLYVQRSALPPAGKGRYYFTDLIGLSALNEQGAEIARVKAAHNFGAGDVMEFIHKDGRGFMLPLKEPFAGDINLKKGTLRISIPEDWLDAPKKEKRDKTEKSTKPKKAGA